MTMKTLYEDADKWHNQSRKKSGNERYRFVSDTLKASLPESFIEESDLAMVILEVKDVLQDQMQFDKLIKLIEILQMFQPALYKRTHFYFDEFLIDFYLFHRDKEKLNEPLSRFEDNPVEGIDSMLSVHAKLLFYEHTDLAIKLASKTYEPVSTSPKLIGGSGRNLAMTMFYSFLEQRYKEFLNTGFFNYDQFTREIAAFDFDPETNLLDQIKKGLVEDALNGEALHHEFFKNKKGCLWTTEYYFLKHMWHKKRMGFAWGSVLWDGLWNYWEEECNKEAQQSDDYFMLKRGTFDSYLTRLIGGFLQMNKAEAASVLWGATYIYDFLLSIGLINENVYKSALMSINSLKTTFMKAFRNVLWKFSFVHYWEPPEGIPQKDFNAESQIFIKSLQGISEDEFENFVPEEVNQMSAITNHTSNPEASEQEPPKTWRNNPCHCGSEKKYKKCCGKSA